MEAEKSRPAIPESEQGFIEEDHSASQRVGYCECRTPHDLTDYMNLACPTNTDLGPLRPVAEAYSIKALGKNAGHPRRRTRRQQSLARPTLRAYEIAA